MVKEKKFLLALILSFFAFVLGFSLCIYEVRENRELKNELLALHLNKGEKVIVGIKKRSIEEVLTSIRGIFPDDFEVNVRNSRNKAMIDIRRKNFLSTNKLLQSFFTLSRLYDVEVDNLCIGRKCPFYVNIQGKLLDVVLKKE